MEDYQVPSRERESMTRKRALEQQPPKAGLLLSSKGSASPAKRSKNGKEDALGGLGAGPEGGLPQPLVLSLALPLTPSSPARDSPLCDSPSKLNALKLRLDDVTGFDKRERAGSLPNAATPVTSLRRSPRGGTSPWAAPASVPVEKPSFLVTELVFRVALCLVAQSQPDYGSSGADLPAQGAWPRVCHPMVMELLRHIVFAEEALARQPDKSGIGSPTTRSRSLPLLHRQSTPSTSGIAATATPRHASVGGRSRGGLGFRSTPRVRFHTFDLPAVETPDLGRPGSEQPMKALLTRAQRILASAAAVRRLLAEHAEPSAGEVENQDPRKGLDALVRALEALATPAGDRLGGAALPAGQHRWGPEHRKAADFYAKELHVLCLQGVFEDDEAPPQQEQLPRGLAASRVHVRYQDALSSIVRYELKALLNVCACKEDDDEDPAPSAPAWCPGGSGAARGARSRKEAAAAACSCLVVVEGTGSVSFNTEDPAALVNLALQRLYPMLPLTMELFPLGPDGAGAADSVDASVAAARSWEGCPGSEDSDSEAEGDGEGFDVDFEPPEDRLRRKVWRRTLRYVQARRAFAIAASPASAAAAVPAGVDTGSNGEPGGAVVDEEALLTMDEMRDMLGYVAGHQFLSELFADPVVMSGVTEGRWARVESRAREVHAYGESTDNGCMSLLEDVAALAAAVSSQAPTVELLGQLLQEEAEAAALRRRERLGIRKRLKTRLMPGFGSDAVADDLTAFPTVRPWCRHIIVSSCWP